jgi:hypothetical protein
MSHDPNRRWFLGATGMGIAFTQLGMATKSNSNTSLPPLKQLDAGLLNIGYVEAGHNLPQEAPRAFARAIMDVEHL